MGILKYRYILILFLIVMPSCDIFEMRGFITPYEQVNDRFLQSQEWNSLHDPVDIIVPKTGYTINIFGDSHLGRTENLDNFFQLSTENNVATVVMAGDITSGNESDYIVLNDHLPSQDSLQYFAVVGNHDLFFNGWEQFRSIFGSSSYYFTVTTPNNRDLYICLDTGGGTLGDLQFDWLKDFLETNRNDYENCVIITHNNIFRLRETSSTNPMTEEIRALTDVFLRYNVNMVVTAHDHVRNTDVLGNTVHIIMDSLQDTNPNASYLKLSVNGNNIEYSFIEL